MPLQPTPSTQEVFEFVLPHAQTQTNRNKPLVRKYPYQLVKSHCKRVHFHFQDNQIKRVFWGIATINIVYGFVRLYIRFTDHIGREWVCLEGAVGARGSLDGRSIQSIVGQRIKTAVYYKTR